MASRALRKGLRIGVQLISPAPCSRSQLCRFASSWSGGSSSEPTPNRRPNKNNKKNSSSISENSNSNNYNNRDLEESYTHAHRAHLAHFSRFHVASQDPNLFRVFFRSPDKIHSLEEAQVFISNIKSTYGPLTQYQFSRCPQTKKYFGYGFLTFKKQESFEKALEDGFIRVGVKDFELKRTGQMPVHREIIYKNTGFNGFYDLDVLRGIKKPEQAQVQEQENNQPKQKNKKNKKKKQPVQDDMNASSASSQDLTSSELEKEVSATTSDISLTSTPPSPDSSPDSSSSSALSAESSGPSEPAVATKKHFFTIEKKTALAQLWKTIPDNIARSERVKAQENGDNSNDDEVSEASVVTSQKIADLVVDSGR
ncbi:hypothetical protein BGZ98_006011 [Dissophora globulifera]|nr:hypothetical protein BGZ98_006011 [Dissophora globulifera]